jgi:hypothetical protein
MKPEFLDGSDSHWPWSKRAVINAAVIGWVDQWGVVEEHERGYRSQYVKVDSFIQVSEEWAQAHYPSDWASYGVPNYAQYVERTHMQADIFDVPVVIHG